MAVALFGHSGLEWDLTETTDDERRRLAEWVALVKQLRLLLHSGELVRVDRPADPDTTLLGVVAPDATAAAFLFVRSATSPRIGDAPVIFAGLDPARRYRVARLGLFESDEVPQSRATALKPVEAPGSLLMTTGVAGPGLLPESAAVYQLTAIGP
jgi:alpha-galactosidase